MKKKKRVAAMLILLMVALVCGACGPAPGVDSGSGGGGEKKDYSNVNMSDLTIGWSQRGMTLAWWEAQVNAGVELAKELGVKDVIVLDAQNKPEKQLSDIEDLIARKVDFIIVDACDPTAIKSALDNAIAAGIPVVAVDSSINPDEVAIVSFITSDNYTIGYNTGYALAQAWGKAAGANAVVMSGAMGDVEGYQRRTGFIAGFSEYQYEKFGSCDINVLAQRYAGDWDADRAMNQMQDIFTKYPGQVDILFSEGDAMAIGCLNAVELAGAKLPLIGSVDGQREALQLVKDNKITAIGVNSARLIGQTAIKVIQSYMAGEAIPKKIMVDSPTIIKDNVDQYYDPNLPFL